ncbi:MAG TPA: PLP-dependent aspartate aminotransferase family protein [Spirochaetia bacterium]
MDDITYILHHMGEESLPENAVSPPIFQTSIFCFKDFREFQRVISDETHNRLYTRGNNPTVNLAEQKIAALEHGQKAKLLGAGVAAISNSLMTFVRAGDHVICVKDAYTWAQTLVGKYLPRFGVEYTFVDGTNVEEIEKAIRPTTKVIYLESPTSLTFTLQDVPTVTALAKARGITTIIDNTWATPIFCNPLDLGVDIVVHSASKYLGGNSDLVAGVMVGSEELIDRITWQESLQLGSVADPFMAWLILRGLRTLHIRLPVHYANAMAVAQFLEKSPKVQGVCYPFLDSFPQVALARRLMRGGSGLLSFRLKTKRLEDVIAFTDALRLFKRAVSWGGYESLIYPNAVSYQGNPPADRLNLVRLHIGLEERDAILADLEQALGAVRS